MTNRQDLLIELGTEELPPKNLKTLMAVFAQNFEKALVNAKLGFDTVEAFATPRRLAVRVKNLDSEQPSQEVERRGPALKAALDDDGQPTKAALGFMRSCGVESIDQLEKMDTDKGTWLMFRQQQIGATLESLIESLLTQSLKELPIERRMRWGATRHEFVRPVHWLVVLYGDQILPCSFLGIGSGRVSRGHRFMSAGEFEISVPSAYLEELKQQKVVADFVDRRDIICKQLAEIGEQESATVEIDPALLDEVTALVEWPVALLGSFPKEFLEVPEEALISAMKEHQRYFHLTDQSGAMAPKFITISNIESIHPENVISGNEKVILPRLTDARFFVQQDQKSTLEDKRARLESVIFQSELGTYLAKADRVEALARYIAEKLQADADSTARGASLCKSDLVSDMVNEFPDLQGLMGGYYAKFEGESELVQAIISEHYFPTSSGGDLPKSLEAKCVAIADKLDTLVGMFGIGQPPTGSKDPFALRRQTLGIIRMCIEGNLDITIDDLLNASIRIHGKSFDASDIRSYVIERLKNWYQDEGIRFDSVDAVVTTPDWQSHLSNSHKTIQALEVFRDSDQASALIAANKRVANILKKQQGNSDSPVDQGLFQEEEETNLFTAILDASDKLEGLSMDSDKLSLLGSLRDQVDAYFDKVMVMADDDALKNNRVATLSSLRRLFLRVADLSVLQ